MTAPRKRVTSCEAEQRDGPVEYSSPACLSHEFEAHRHPPGAADVRIKRIYDEPDSADGLRILVDRLWPRGISKQKAGVDIWARELAPSTLLRRWFRHDPARWIAFRERDHEELHAKAADLEALRERSRTQRVTLLYAAKDQVFNHASVIMEMLLRN